MKSEESVSEFRMSRVHFTLDICFHLETRSYVYMCSAAMGSIVMLHMACIKFKSNLQLQLQLQLQNTTDFIINEFFTVFKLFHTLPTLLKPVRLVRSNSSQIEFHQIKKIFLFTVRSKNMPIQL